MKWVLFSVIDVSWTPVVREMMLWGKRFRGGAGFFVVSWNELQPVLVIVASSLTKAISSWVQTDG